MDKETRVLASESRQRFFGHIRATDVLPVYHLVRIARAADLYSPKMRSAALRNLVARAPLEITKGATFIQRRKAVRLHYGV